MVYKCSSCGKEFNSNAMIIGRKVLCPDCAEQLEDIIDECTAEAIEAYLSGRPVDVESSLRRFDEKITKLGIRRSRIKAIILTRLVALRPLR